MHILIECTLNHSLNLSVLTRFITAMQAFLQGGLGDSGPRLPGSGQTLPHNLRIISNFFRTAPDGSVRAFSQPIVHERSVRTSVYLFVYLFVCLSVYPSIHPSIHPIFLFESFDFVLVCVIICRSVGNTCND